MILKKDHLKSVTMNNCVVLTPMAGICNSAFRLAVKEFGAGLVYEEMISDKGIVYKNDRTMGMLHIDEREYPLSLQIFGGEKDTLVEAAQYVDKHTAADVIDINMGCPVNKIIKCEAGAKWLLDPNKIHEMVSAVVAKVDKPVSVKMRIGWSAVAVHGRTRLRMYEGKANWDITRKMKEAVSIPVIGNGDVETPQDAKRMIDQTNVDGVMIGRAALGNPWMMYRTVQYLETGELMSEPNTREKIDVCLLHFGRLMALKGEHVAVRDMRKHASWYMKGIRGNAKIRNMINAMETADDLTNLMNGFADEMMGREQVAVGISAV
jgi:tRNA-dihydrouridine synthase